MVFFQVFLIVVILGSTQCQGCHLVQWWPNGTSDYQATCKEMTSYFSGLVRTETTSQDRSVFYLRGAECCLPNQEWNFKEILVEYTDWSEVMVKKETWVDCPSGYFLAGLGGVGKWREDDNMLDFSRIVAVRCMKPAGHPIYYGDCYSEETVKCFTQNNTCSCKAGYYVTGMYKSSGIEFKSLESLRCCSIAPKPKEVPTFSALKTGIMEKTLRHLAVLADGLGFSNSRGIRGKFCGEDFVRDGDTWQASSKMMEKKRPCQGEYCFERLKIEYGNWSLGVRDITYGQTYVNILSPEIIDSGMISNLASSQVTENLDISKTVQETITHNVGKCFSTSPGLAVEFNFDIPLPDKESLKYRSEVELSDSDDTKTSTLDTKTLQSKLSIILQPNSAVNYKVTLMKSKTIIPYKAVIAVKFSIEFKGYLKWGRSKSIPFANHHYLEKGLEQPLYFEYRFGGKSVPFYTALKNENETQAPPWLWKSMLQSFNGVTSAMDQLLNEKWYEFQIEGTLEIISDSKLEVVWRRDE